MSPSRVIGLRAGNAPTKDVLRGDAPSVHESGVGRAARIVVVDHPKAIHATCRGAILAVADIIVELLLEGGIFRGEGRDFRTVALLVVVIDKLENGPDGGQDQDKDTREGTHTGQNGLPRRGFPLPDDHKGRLMKVFGVALDDRVDVNTTRWLLPTVTGGRERRTGPKTIARHQIDVGRDRGNPLHEDGLWTVGIDARDKLGHGSPTSLACICSCATAF